MGDSTFLCCAYCWKHENNWETILSYKCDRCCKRVHYDCIKSHQPSVLLGDTFFSFNCEACSENGNEQFERLSISWMDAVILALYNLHKSGQGMCGFYHWKSHICTFIEKHWHTFFGANRKRTNLWQGTVAGTLSSGCPQYFESGASIVEQGFWRLATLQPPLPQTERKCQRNKSKPKDTPVELKSGQLRCRAPKESSLSAAMELKEKRSVIKESKGRKKAKVEKDPEPSTSFVSFGVEEDSRTKTKPKQGKKKTSKKQNNSSADIEPPVFDSQDSISSTSSVDKKKSSKKQKLTVPPIEPSVIDSQDSLSSTSSAGLALSLGAELETTTINSHSANAFGGIWTAMEMDDDSDLDIEVDIDASFITDNIPDMRPASPDINTMLNLGPEILQNQFQELPQDKFEETPQTQFEDAFPPLELPEVEIKTEPASDCESEGQSERDIEDRSVRGEETETDNSSGGSDDENEEDDEDTEMRSLQGADSSQVADGKEKDEQGKNKKGRPRKRRRADDTPPPSPPPRLERISLFEEGELLQKLNKKAEKETLPPRLAVLRRKLICNQTNREFGLPVLDLDLAVGKEIQKNTEQKNSTDDGPSLSQLPRKVMATKETRDLDRFTTQGSKKVAGSREYSTFRQRLVGLEDHELKPFVSPYTTRLLLPFIWRNYNPSVKPMKMRLLQEIVAHHHRNEPDWQPPPSPPIDYCYVRPEHISSVNALCREFFWPGIDMSECLQYPDYSCVVMYRKIVIAFAFLVPDRGYNEAYISFVFTHPEWRGAGISTFMVYHLIQTCMGKDVVLHVSATNPAMFLYQRFGFKAEEFILNFYHKYFPLDCKDSTNAFMMRLSR